MQHTIYCPQPDCGAPAEIVDRWTWRSSDGPVERVKTCCVNGHGFTPPADALAIQPTPSLPNPPVRVTVS